MSWTQMKNSLFGVTVSSMAVRHSIDQSKRALTDIGGNGKTKDSADDVGDRPLYKRRNRTYKRKSIMATL